MSEYFRIPKLGQHYTLRWATEDMEYERSKSNGNNDSENTNRNAGAASEGTKFWGTTGMGVPVLFSDFHGLP